MLCISPPAWGTEAALSEDGVVNLGTQPLRIPSGMILEALRRDGVLAEEMAKTGGELHFHVHANGDDIRKGLAAGTAGLAGGVGGRSVALMACADRSARIASLVAFDFSAVVARKWSAVTDLQGKTLGIAAGTNAHYGLLHLFKSVDLPEASIRLQEMAVGQLPDALRAGRIDAFSAWEPIPSVAIRQDGAKIIHRAFFPAYLLFSSAFHARHPERVRLIIAAQIRALDWLEASATNARQAMRWVREATGPILDADWELTLDDLDRSFRIGWQYHAYSPLVTAEALQRDPLWAGSLEWLVKKGAVPAGTRREDLAECLLQDDVMTIQRQPSRYRLGEFRYPPLTTDTRETP
ncbi:MAG: ABC transporter substrate-binding protein [Magnetococcales bacterium]|nr:ABC transporter substrate-binding protein [Magnetococcales bacterium]